MAEKYVKEILAKLEEIEKLHVKLRSMVSRIKNHETGSSSDVDRKSSRPKRRKESVTIKEKEKNPWKQKLSDIGIDADKLQNPRGSKYIKKLRSNTFNFVTGQWRDKKEKVKNFLTGLVERDMIFATRASQTTDSIVPLAKPDAQQTGNENSEFPWKDMRYAKNRVSVQKLLGELLEHFNYSRDSDPQMEGRVSIHDHSIGNREPRRVRRESSLLPEEETSRTLSNARAVPIDDSETDSALSSRVRRFVRNYSNTRSR